MGSNESVEGGILHNNLLKKNVDSGEFVGVAQPQIIVSKERFAVLIFCMMLYNAKAHFKTNIQFCQRLNSMAVVLFNTELVLKNPKLYSRYKHRGKYLTDCKRHRMEK